MIHALHHILERPRPWRHLDPGQSMAEHYRVTTDDGVTLALRRLRPPTAPTAPPVMMLHGLAANHRGFHFPQRSLAGWLVERGHEVWLPELRGHGDSRLERFDWRFDDYLAHDLPALIEAVRAHSQADQIHWVGHSMGGILLMCYGILHPNAPIARGVTIGSALDYKVGATGFKALLRLRPVLERLVAVPYGSAMHLLAPAIGRLPLGVHSFNVWPSNIEAETVRTIHAACFNAIPTSLLTSLATTFEPEGLRLESGFRFVENADDFPFPLRMLAGSRDAQVSVPAIEHTAELLGDNAQVVVHGPQRGDADHYGHWDLLVGRRAPVETWPSIAHWLEEG